MWLLNLCLFYPSVSVGRLFAGVILTVLYPEMDAEQFVMLNSPKSILLVVCLLLTTAYALILRVFVFTYSRMDWEAKPSMGMFFDVALIQLICWINIPFSGVIAVQTALIMLLQVSGRSLPVSVSVIICTFIFALQSESGASIFHVSGSFCTIDFVFVKLLIYNEMLSNTCLYMYHSALYNIVAFISVKTGSDRT